MSGVTHAVVTESEAGQKLLQFLMRRVGKDIPKSALMKWIRTGQVRVNKGRVQPFLRLKKGDDVRIPPYSNEEKNTVRAVAGPLNILAETNDMLVLHKPAGLPVQPGTGHEDSITTRLAATYAEYDFMPTPAHRLDRDTSGILLVASSYTRLRILHEWFREGRKLHKEYLCWVVGEWPHSEPVILEDFLDKKAGADGKERVSSGSGKLAKCTVTPVHTHTTGTLLHVLLHTGRTHQIRAQLSERGFPIFGDHKYGGPCCALGMLLHAWRIRMPDGEFTCLPEWMGIFTVTENMHLPE